MVRSDSKIDDVWSEKWREKGEGWRYGEKRKKENKKGIVEEGLLCWLFTLLQGSTKILDKIFFKD